LEYLSLRADRVLWGIGPANWRALSESYFGKFTIIHNPVIDIFVENGIFSTILFTLFFAYMGIMALRMYQRGGETSWVGIMVLTALLVTFNTGLFSYTPFFILGLGEAYYRIVASAKYVLPQGNPQQQEIINATL
jgi:O-antigen ligase